jgi:hypothetical protein
MISFHLFRFSFGLLLVPEPARPGRALALVPLRSALHLLEAALEVADGPLPLGVLPVHGVPAAAKKKIKKKIK